MKITLHGVAETLLITLYIRAKDAMAKHPILNDQKSLAIVEQIEYDFDKFDNSEASFYATLARIRVMDREIKKFIRENPIVKSFQLVVDLIQGLKESIMDKLGGITLICQRLWR